MITGLVVENFKAFGGSHFIPMAPITLLYGPNSAGKSTILQAILALKQTFSQPYQLNTPLLLKGPLTDLGTYRDAIFRHDLNRDCMIAVLSRSPSGTDHDDAVAPFPSQTGTGVRAFFDAESSTVKLRSIPIYYGESSTPTYEFVGMERLAESEVEKLDTYGFDGAYGVGGSGLREMIREGTWFAVPGNFDRYHPYWENLYHYLSEELLATLIAELESICAEIAEVIKAGRPPEPPQLTLFDTDDPVDPKFANAEKFVNNCVDAGPGGDDKLAPWRHALDVARRYLDRYQDYSYDAFLEDLAATNAGRFLAVRGLMPQGVFGFRPEERQSVVAHLMSSKGFAYSDAFGQLARHFRSRTNVADPGVLLHGLSYLGPLRTYPQRFYVESGAVPRDVGMFGEYTPDILFQEPELLRRANEALAQMEIDYELVVPKYRNLEIEGIYALRLNDKRTNTMASIKDIGFGVSQVLPLVVQSLLLKGSTILVEQPELHLHPRLQAELGTLIAASVRMLANQFIVETHSEHLMPRLQRLIRRGELRPSDVLVIDVQRNGDGSSCVPLRIGDDGEFIDRWPGGFFEDDYREVFGQ